MIKELNLLMRILFDRRIPSLLLLFINYFTVYGWRLWHSSFFSVPQLMLLLVLVGTLQYFLARMFLSGDRGKVSFVVTMYLIFIIIFYSMNVVDAFNVVQQEQLGHQYVRGVIISWVLFLILAWVSYRKSSSSGFAFQNIFLGIFSVISLIAGWRSQVSYPAIESFQPNYKTIPFSNIKETPVVLIVLDEYASSKTCFKVTNDSAYYNFNKQLEKRGWIVKDDMYSYEGSTIHSLASAFSFNLSEAGTFKDASSYHISTNKLMRNVLYDSLHGKGVEIVNWGIIDLGAERPKQRLYFYPRNFLELLSRYTVFYYWLSGDPVNYNKRVLETAGDKINGLDQRSFMYMHLFMPHSPFEFEPSFPKMGVSTQSYLRFRQFTDEKMLVMIDRLFRKSGYRVIITGDHGYRDDLQMDYHSTFTAFWGFTEEQVAMVKSVQDLGSLVNSAFYHKRSF